MCGIGDWRFRGHSMLIAYTLQWAVAVLLDLRTLPGAPPPRRYHRLIIVAALPFVAIQLVEDVGVTANYFQSPTSSTRAGQSHSRWLHRRIRRQRRPLHSKPPAKSREFYDIFLKPTIEAHRVDNIFNTFLTKRLPRVTFVTLFTGTLVLLLPTFLLARSMPRAAVLWAMLPLYLLIYTTFPFLLKHYAIVAAPAMSLIVVLGLRGIVESVPTTMQRGADVFLVLFLAGIAIPPIMPNNDDGYPMQNVVFAAKHMPRIVHQPAIVLFHYEPGGKFHEEPVYNIDAAWPDDEPTIRAHDLGPERNRELFQYYAQRQPQRTVWVFDRMNATMTHLGNVVDLAHLPVAPSAMRTTTTKPKTITTQRTLDEP
jgi:hypothetical protein